VRKQANSFLRKRTKKLLSYGEFALPQRLRQTAKKFLLICSKRSAFWLSTVTGQHLLVFASLPTGRANYGPMGWAFGGSGFSLEL
jgi:hypothetical protein